MIGRGPGGAVAGGSPWTVEAGLHALALGGNAVDAAVAAQLAACVAEPLLTGLAGGGLATYKVGDQVGVCDFFGDVPGAGRQGPPPGDMTTVVVDFGPTTQAFSVGAPSVSVPGLAQGMAAMHARFGTVPLERLVEPAARVAREGFDVLPGFERVATLLWPILSLDPSTRSLLGRDGRPLREGERFACPELGDTLEAFAALGAKLFTEGPIGQALLDAVGAEGWLTAADLERYQPVFREALCLRRGGARVWVPGTPSQGGPLTLKALLSLWDAGPLPVPLTAAHVLRVAQCMDVAERSRPEDWPAQLFEQGFVPRYLGAGYTTHISAVDGHGNAVAITSSLGETAGMVVPGTGLMPNNFLGETDVNPPGFPRPVGARLMTMCCPTLLELPEKRIYAMGSGGSSRIRSAVLHGVVYLAENGLNPAQAVAAPRAHMEDGVLRVEIAEREAREVALLRAAFPDMVEFDAPGMYFGGLHIAGLGAEGFVGAGDARRSGAFGVYQ